MKHLSGSEILKRKILENEKKEEVIKVYLIITQIYRVLPKILRSKDITLPMHAT